MNMTLAWFLTDHYATSSDSAKALAAYLDAVDAAAPRSAAKSARPPKRAPKPASAQ